MTKTLLVAIASLPPTKSGIAVYSWNFYKALSNFIPVKVITKNSSKEKMEGGDGFEVLTTRNIFSLTKNVIRVLKMNHTIISYQLGLRSIGSHITTFVFSFILIFLKKIFEKCLITTLHTIPTPQAIKQSLKKLKPIYSLIYGAYRVLINTVLENSNGVVVHSDYMEKCLRKHYKLNESKIMVIPHGLNFYKCHKRNKRKKKFQILIHGFLRETKGIPLLLESVKIMKKENLKIRLVIAGSAHMGEKAIKKFNKIAKEFGLEKTVKIIPKFIPDSLLEKIICESDLIVLPYQDKFIEVSGVLAKSLPAGKPIICSKIPKFMIDRDISQHITFIENLNPHTLTEKIKEIIYNYKNETKKSQKLIEIARKRSWVKVAQEFANKIKERCRGNHFLP